MLLYGMCPRYEEVFNMSTVCDVYILNLACLKEVFKYISSLMQEKRQLKDLGGVQDLYEEVRFHCHFAVRTSLLLYSLSSSHEEVSNLSAVQERNCPYLAFMANFVC